MHRRIDVKPRSDGRDAFGAVARATGSGVLVNSVELGAVWAAIPGLYRLPVESWRPDWRLALTVSEEPSAWQFPTYALVKAWSFSGNPLSGGFDGSRYPTLPSNARVQVTSLPESPGDWIASIAWSAEIASVEAVAPVTETGDERYLIPLLPGNDQLLSPLMLWWILLYGLSIYARYYPGLWGSTLALDESEWAVPLRTVLDRAVTVLPSLVYDAVTD